MTNLEWYREQAKLLDKPNASQYDSRNTINSIMKLAEAHGYENELFLKTGICKICKKDRYTCGEFCDHNLCDWLFKERDK